MSYRVVMPDGRVSNTVVVRNNERLAALSDVEFNGSDKVVAVHEFDLSKAGAVAELKLVTMDLLPGDATNCVSSRIEPGGFVPVAVMTTDIFDAADVDVSSLTLGGVRSRGTGGTVGAGSLEDVDDDGDLDLVAEFGVDGLQITDSDEVIVLDGFTKSGKALQAVDPGCIGSRLLVSVRDEGGQPVMDGTVEILTEYGSDPESNFAHSYGLARWRGLIPILIDWGSDLATISVRVVTADGRVSDTLEVTNHDWVLAFRDGRPNNQHLDAAHEFHLGRSDVVTELRVVTMDLLPGDATNCVSAGAAGPISVAILTTPRFDAHEADVSSLTLRAALSNSRGRAVDQVSGLEDVDGDGDVDLVVRFTPADLRLAQSDAVIVLEGVTKDGVAIQAMDPLCVVP